MTKRNGRPIHAKRSHIKDSTVLVNVRVQWIIIMETQHALKKKSYGLQNVEQKLDNIQKKTKIHT